MDILNQNLETDSKEIFSYVKRPMTGRPRKASDEEVFGAVARAIARLGPGEVTLADIAEEAGITAGALVQRFGSKRELLLAFVSLGAGSTGDIFADLRAKHASPLAALYEYADCFARMGESPATLAHHLGFLQLDLTDPDFRRLARVHARATDREIRALIEAAIEAGELSASVDAPVLTRALQAVIGGSLIGWALRQEGSAARYVRKDLEAVLHPNLLR